MCGVRDVLRTVRSSYYVTTGRTYGTCGGWSSPFCVGTFPPTRSFLAHTRIHTASFVFVALHRTEQEKHTSPAPPHETDSEKGLFLGDGISTYSVHVRARRCRGSGSDRGGGGWTLGLRYGALPYRPYVLRTDSTVVTGGVLCCAVRSTSSGFVHVAMRTHTVVHAPSELR